MTGKRQLAPLQHHSCETLPLGKQGSREGTGSADMAIAFEYVQNHGVALAALAGVVCVQDGATPLAIALHRGHSDVVETLRTSGAVA